VVVRAAYGDSGVYLLLAVRDDAWQTDSGLGDSADCVVVFADALPSTTIASCTDCSIGLGHKSLSYTTNYLRIETGAGNSVKFSQYDDNMWSWIEHTLPKSDLGRLWGITCEEIASPSGERSVELLIRWGTFRRIGGPWPPSSGTLLGLSVGYDDRDAPSATKSLRWLGKDPWADDADSVQYWGDLRIGMRP